ncbi:hypothetical protein QBC38DRAFT_98843 [Podospora fimiseda]|uniref:Cell wall biogenesis protein Mhp1 n=1 Tax=Podospora fimiseda TaxID=252190 RepID=A0AAN7BVA9_9PEZI|nr:hypothetical protein QBC38DRAFT_98843 [Podospora fimiseda]
MEQFHGIDVSWMTHGSKDKFSKTSHTRQRSLSNNTARDLASQRPLSPTTTTANGSQTEHGKPTQITTSVPRPILGRSTSADEKHAHPQTSTTPPTNQRRGSWFSNISSKFSSTGGLQSPPQANTASTKPAELSVPKANPNKNAVLQPGMIPEGEGPYTPAPPRSSQSNGLLQVFRRLSSSNGNLPTNAKPHNHGLVERRVLNVDRHRERCDISGLNQAKLRRVAFCVDVEIAPMPKYIDEMGEKKVRDRAAKDLKKKAETEAQLGKGSSEGDAGDAASVNSEAPAPSTAVSADSKKKEKKKKSEEERKARKEKRRRQAEANGTIPMELRYDSDSSTDSVPSTTQAKPAPQTMPTTNPVRIYRRCCQLRETPILKKITEQLMDTTNFSAETGMVEKLDLSGYYMQLPDLITLGDYLAVVPVRELILDSCGLADEGLRVVLAGLLAARRHQKVPIALKRRQQQRSKCPLSTESDGLTEQGGVVERLVLKNNKIGPEGWRHICLFIYLCKTLKSLDLSGIQFPRFVPSPCPPQGADGQPAKKQTQALCTLLTRSLGERLGGATLSLLSMGQTGLSTDQLGAVIDGVIQCGIKRLGIAHNDINSEGLAHVARFLKSNLCEGLDLGGNDLRESLGILADSLDVEKCPLWALSLADCNLAPSSLCKLFPTLVKLEHFRFIDLSHNHDLFSSDPSAVAVLRRYLPKMACLKRIHLADCTLNAEQAIALAEILPEITGLAHVSFLENKQLVELTTNASSEEKQEEACALFASLLAAARVSTSLIAVDIEVPSEQSSDLVKAMAKQVVAYGLRNMEAATIAQAEATLATNQPEEPVYPDVLQRLVGHDVTLSSDADADVDAAPDNDYVIGGTGVVKALACCLKNRGDDSRRQSMEFLADVENGVSAAGERENATANASSGKAKETSKHLLLSARKIRLRLQPAIVKARMAANDTHTYHRLMFLDNTLNGIIKRFEDEYPDTRLSVDSGVDIDADNASLSSLEKLSSSVPAPSLITDNSDLASTAIISDNENDDDVPSRGPLVKRGVFPALSRSNSIISLTSKALADEEARVLRAGHKFRAGIVRPEHYALLTSGVEEVGADPNHKRLLHELLDEMNDEELKKEAEEKGIVEVFQERKGDILQRLKDNDPVHWDAFVESQVMARKNVKPDEEGQFPAKGTATGVNEVAIED